MFTDGNRLVQYNIWLLQNMTHFTAALRHFSSLKNVYDFNLNTSSVR